MIRTFKNPFLSYRTSIWIYFIIHHLTPFRQPPTLREKVPTRGGPTIVGGSCPVHSQQMTTWPLIYRAVTMTEICNWSSQPWSRILIRVLIATIASPFPPKMTCVIVLRTRCCLFDTWHTHHIKFSLRLSNEDPNYLCRNQYRNLSRFFSWLHWNLYVGT